MTQTIVIVQCVEFVTHLSSRMHWQGPTIALAHLRQVGGTRSDKYGSKVKRDFKLIRARLGNPKKLCARKLTLPQPCIPKRSPDGRQISSKHYNCTPVSSKRATPYSPPQTPWRPKQPCTHTMPTLNVHAHELKFVPWVSVSSEIETSPFGVARCVGRFRP